MRGDLTKIDGIVADSIETNPAKRLCSFQISDPDVDYKTELVKYAETNQHLAGYTIQ